MVGGIDRMWIQNYIKTYMQYKGGPNREGKVDYITSKKTGKKKYTDTYNQKNGKN